MSAAVRSLLSTPLAIRVSLALALVTLTAAACTSGTSSSSGRSGSTRVDAAQQGDPRCRTVLVAAGDIVNDVPIAERTGRLALAQHPNHVLVLGDNQYGVGSLAQYRSEYDRTAWGQLRRITKPVPGNHEYRTPGAAGYFAYFDNPKPYYAFPAGCGWRAYALNSEIDLSKQAQWLRSDLAAHPDAPVVAYWHRPRWSSGVEHGSDADLQPLWDALAGRTGVVLNGHDHDYERFAPVGRLREFVVGTGGSSTYHFGPPAPGSERRISNTPGVLRLVLQPGSHYSWVFLSIAGPRLDEGADPGPGP